MKYFLVFTPDRGSREDCSVYYSDLVIAETMDEAKQKFIAHATKEHKKAREKSLKRLLTPQELNQITSMLTFIEGDDEDSGTFDILEVKPIV